MEMKIVRKSNRNNNVIPACEVIGHVMKVEDISKIKPARINWGDCTVNKIKNVVINGDVGQLSATYLDGTVVTIDMCEAMANDCPESAENPESILNEIRLHRINWENCSEGITPV